MTLWHCVLTALSLAGAPSLIVAQEVAKGGTKPSTPAPKSATPASKSATDSSKVSAGASAVVGAAAAAKTIPAVAKPAAAAVAALAITPLTDDTAPTGCGCFFYRPTNKRELGPLLFKMNGDGSASVKPNGELATLKLVDEQHSRKLDNTISAQDRMLLKLRGENTNASISGLAERNCVKNSSGNACASVSYQAVLSVDHKGRKISMPAWGFCGCR